MPFLAPLVPLLPAIIGGGAAIGASVLGSRSQGQAIDAAEQARQEEAAFRERLINLGTPPFEAATNYWQSLLQGGQPARVAVGPFAQEISSAAQAGRRGIEETLPRGGERNLALAQSRLGQGRDISRLFSGVQPEAAGRLAQLAGIPFGVSTASTGALASQNIAGLQAGIAQGQQNLESATGFGRLIYNLFNKSRPGTSTTTANLGQIDGVPLSINT